ncbi:(d)CMP kinase [Acuticoccus yangtzensis]|uniref:(d)CMP kinase n=1 Tax=Acuticoccus yangtzensis TaxID=1443441 RepID=UPI000949542A|nr:(d)CMP kinase [Acuticoccus yangtzensis]ORE95214.1 cytidylate kinase [Stappia sp. 22II-S9-Z10]
MIIAVDGPAASGKGTLARRLAATYGLAYLDTGRTYRAVALAMQRSGAAFDDEEAAVAAAAALDFALIDDPAITSAEAGEGASQIAVMPRLRASLVERQRAFAEEARAAGRGAVLDGRDVGTVILPGADVKLFVTADVAERARRRALELHGEAEGPHFEALLANLKRRDARDTGRAASPLAQAADAYLLDTTHMDAEAAFSAAVRVVERAAVA